MSQTVKLILEDGTEIQGESFGALTSAAGEVVFSTAMTGYPENLTDPSFAGQILVLTTPMVGNYGVPGEELYESISKIFESDKIHIAGLVVNYYSEEHSHWNAAKSLGDWLKEYNIPGIFGVDTRMLTKKLREKGAMLGKNRGGGRRASARPQPGQPSGPSKPARSEALRQRPAQNRASRLRHQNQHHPLLPGARCGIDSGALGLRLQPNRLRWPVLEQRPRRP